MNDIFIWSRFRALAVRDFTENGRRYLYTLGAVVVYCTVFFVIKYFGNNFPLEPFVWIGGLAFVMTSVAFCFKPYRRKGRQIGSLTLPASVFEKYAYVWIQSLVVTAAVYLGALLLINWLAGQIMPGLQLTRSNFGGSIWPFVWSAAWLHALAVFAHTTFRRPVFGYFFAGAATLVFGFVYHLVIKLFFAREGGPGGNLDLGTIDSYRVVMSERGSAYVQYIVSGIPDYRAFLIILLSLWIVMFWVTGYFKLKEPQLK